MHINRQQIGQKEKSFSTKLHSDIITPDSTTSGCNLADNSTSTNEKRKSSIRRKPVSSRPNCSETTSSLLHFKKAKGSLMECIKARKQSLLSQQRKNLSGIDLSSSTDLYNLYMQTNCLVSSNTQVPSFSNWRLRRRKTFADPQLLLAGTASSDVTNIQPFPWGVSPASTASDWIKSLSPLRSSEGERLKNETAIGSIFEYYTSLIAYSKIFSETPPVARYPEDGRVSPEEIQNCVNVQYGNSYISEKLNMTARKESSPSVTSNSNHLKFSVNAILGL